MKLEEYRKQAGLGRAKLAKLLGVKRNAVYRWENGAQIPNREMMQQIYDRTGGAVKATDFHDQK